jgi:hypothetical protein
MGLLYVAPVLKSLQTDIAYIFGIASSSYNYSVFSYVMTHLAPDVQHHSIMSHQRTQSVMITTRGRYDLMIIFCYDKTGS